MTPVRGKNPLSENALLDLAGLKDDAARAKYLARRPRLCRMEVVQQLNDIVRAKLRGDTRQALALAEAAICVARKLRNREALGRSLRSKANALYMTGDNQDALKFHEQALAIFRKIGADQEAARTLIPSIQPHILLGQYDRAVEAAEAARTILENLGDRQRLGHLEINVGNIYHRQDRF
ncbi:MAG: tetratricopeptide repeat protein, partial [Candidatus Acidiferrales bacterium]